MHQVGWGEGHLEVAGICTVDDLIIHFSLGIISLLSQIKGSGLWVEGNKTPSDQEVRKKKTVTRVQTAKLSQDKASTAKGKEQDSIGSKSQHHSSVPLTKSFNLSEPLFPTL